MFRHRGLAARCCPAPSCCRPSDLGLTPAPLPRPQPSTAAADKARDFGAGPLFNQILPLLMSPTLEDQERHLLVKVRRGGDWYCHDGC